MQSKYSRSQPIESKLAWFRCREEGMSVSKICELFGMSRKTYYKWRKRYRQEGVEGLSECSTPRRIFDRRPKRLARLTPEPLAARMIRARRRKGYGPVLLAWYLRKHGGLGQFQLFLWLTVVAVALRTFVTIFYIPYLALGAELSDDYQERSSIATYRAALPGSFTTVHSSLNSIVARLSGVYAGHVGSPS